MVKTRLLPAFTLALGLSAILIACSNDTARSSATSGGTGGSAGGGANADSAKQFVAAADKELLELGNKVGRAQWVASNFITSDTEALSADAYKDLVARTMALAKEATKFDKLQLDADTTRRLMLLKLASMHSAAGADRRRRAEGADAAGGLDGSGLRPREILPRRRQAVPRHHRARSPDGDQS